MLLCFRSTAFTQICILLLCAGAVSPLSISRPKGSASKPYDKKNVAVLGCGGYLGAMTFGFLQRAGSLYGTGFANIKSPRSITATGFGSLNLNGVLGKNFVLAQADESFVKLTDMTSVDSIQSRLAGMDAVIMCTRCALETRPVTPNTYEKSPNDKAQEFYMDIPRRSSIAVQDNGDYSKMILQNTLSACSSAGVKHVVVIETDPVFDGVVEQGMTAENLMIVQEVGIPYTYIRPLGELDNIQDYTYIKGIQNQLRVEPMGLEAGTKSTKEGGPPICREDLAALVVQSLQSLDWDSSRSLDISCLGGLDDTLKVATRADKEWCMNSQVYANLLEPIN